MTVDEGLGSIAARSDNNWSEILVSFAGRAVRLVLPLLAILLGAPALAVSPQTEMIVRYAISLLVIATLAYLALQVINVGTMLVLHGQQLSVSDNRRARVIYTHYRDPHLGERARCGRGVGFTLRGTRESDRLPAEASSRKPAARATFQEPRTAKMAVNS